LAARAGPRAMASAALVGGVLLALIEGMGIMFTKMTAPPVPTAEDYERAARQDPTAPPTAPGMSMMQSVMGSSRPPSAPSSSSVGGDASGMSTETVFSTEGSSSEPKKSNRGWFS
jgi:hypothetical protein